MSSLSTLLLLILLYIIDTSEKVIEVNNACKRLPYDFYHLPGTDDYFFLRYEALNPQDARQYCLSQGMDLPSILNRQQNDLIHTIIKSTGTRSRDYRQKVYHTSGVILGNDSFAWLNGDNFTFKNFHKESSTGEWIGSPCDQVGGVVCHVRCFNQF